VDGSESPAAGEITRLLVEWKAGDAGAINRLFPLVYDELRALAHRLLRRSGGEDTLGTTGIVHEAYLKLVDRTQADLNDRNHFFAIASKVMRHILVDHARARLAQKRGSGRAPATLDEEAAGIEARAGEIVAVHEALTKLEALDGRLVEIVEMRFFGGLSIDETAASLGVSPRTVKRDWRKARAFLVLELAPGSP
jgi:RNA polymerase sigma factor (TIGR02999 family)